MKNMKYNSVNEIASFLNISTSAAKQVKGLINFKIDPKNYEIVKDWISECYNEPRQSELILRALNEVICGYGVESIEHKDIYVSHFHQNFVADYVNTGDTYNPTILRDNRTGKYYLATWGDFYETLPQTEE